MHDLADKKKKSLWYKVMYNFCYFFFFVFIEMGVGGGGGGYKLIGQGGTPWPVF